MKDPDRLWLDLCTRFSEQSRCRSRQVGCVVVRDGILLGSGWNGAPKGSQTSDCIRCNGHCNSGEKLEEAICAHAEINCIASCARNGHRTDEAMMYCTLFPCKYCAALIVGAGIREIVYNNEYSHQVQTVAIFKNAGVVVRKIEIEE